MNGNFHWIGTDIFLCSSTDLSELEGHLRVVNYYKLNSVAWVHERAMPTERPPLVGEVSANFCGWHVVSVTDP
jgi:hypothetical protein